ncbi:MAG: serine/threonine-protein phosphatase [bacterium]
MVAFGKKKQKQKAQPEEPLPGAGEHAPSDDDSTDPLLKSPGAAAADGWELVAGSTAGRVERRLVDGEWTFRWVASALPEETMAALKGNLIEVDSRVFPVGEYTEADGAFAVVLSEPVVPLRSFLESHDLRPSEVLQAVADLSHGFSKLAAAGLAPVALDTARLYATLESFGVARNGAGFRIAFANFHELAPLPENFTTNALALQAIEIASMLLDREWTAPWHQEAASEILSAIVALRETAVEIGLEAIPAKLASLLPQIRGCVMTDVGRVRSNNEDAAVLSVENSTRGGGSPCTALGFVADGMGGHAAGEIASALALSAATRTLADWRESAAAGDKVIAQHIARAYARAETAIARDCELHPERSGMGTTLTGALVLSPCPPPDPSARSAAPAFDIARAWIANLGDSRTYLVSGRSLVRISHDHSYVQSLLDAGEISEEEAFHHPARNVISKCLGGNSQEQPRPDVAPLACGPGDVLLSASDGLTDLLTDSEIFAILEESWDAGANPLESAARALIDAANARGGKDNITIVLIAL